MCILVVRKDGPARKMEFWLILFLLIATTTTTMPLQHRLLLCPTDQPLLPLVIRDTLCISGRLVLTYQPNRGYFYIFLGTAILQEITILKEFTECSEYFCLTLIVWFETDTHTIVN